MCVLRLKGKARKDSEWPKERALEKNTLYIRSQLHVKCEEHTICYYNEQ